MSTGGPHTGSCKWCKKALRSAFSKQRLLDRYAEHLRSCKVAHGALERVNADRKKVYPDEQPRSLERFIEMFISAMGGKYTPPPAPLPKLEQVLKGEGTP